jgi:hypothetical protein
MHLPVQYVVACLSITITNDCFTCCSVVIDVIFNTCFGTVICYIGTLCFKGFLNLLFPIIWGELYEKYHHRTYFSFES